MTHEPVFSTSQPDGTTVEVDLREPGAHQDFAFALVRPGNQPVRITAYHTAEPAIFLDVLARMTVDRPADLVLADIERVRSALAENGDSLPPSVSNPFTTQWPRAFAVVRRRSLPFEQHYAADGRDRDGQLVVVGDQHGLTFSDLGHRARPTVGIAITDLWQFALGMIWRTCGSGLRLSRYATYAYIAALDDIEQGFRPVD